MLCWHVVVQVSVVGVSKRGMLGRQEPSVDAVHANQYLLLVLVVQLEQ